MHEGYLLIRLIDNNIWGHQVGGYLVIDCAYDSVQVTRVKNHVEIIVQGSASRFGWRAVLDKRLHANVAEV